MICLLCSCGEFRMMRGHHTMVIAQRRWPPTNASLEIGIPPRPPCVPNVPQYCPTHGVYSSPLGKHPTRPTKGVWRLLSWGVLHKHGVKNEFDTSWLMKVQTSQKSRHETWQESDCRSLPQSDPESNLKSRLYTQKKDLWVTFSQKVTFGF